MVNTRDRISTIAGGGVASPVRPRRKANSPRIRLVTPRSSFVVRDDVFILIDAVSEVDGPETLKVDIQIDGGRVIRAKHSLASGYYGAIWDSSSERSGTMHSLIARVTDSEGNSSSTMASIRIG